MKTKHKRTKEQCPHCWRKIDSRRLAYHIKQKHEDKNVYLKDIAIANGINPYNADNSPYAFELNHLHIKKQSLQSQIDRIDAAIKALTD